MPLNEALRVVTRSIAGAALRWVFGRRPGVAAPVGAGLPIPRRATGRKALVDADARDLIARYGAGAYGVARDRSRQDGAGTTLDANRPEGHWRRVKSRVADLTGHEVGLDTATRMASRTDD